MKQFLTKPRDLLRSASKKKQPATRGSVHGYRAEFGISADALLDFVRRCPEPPAPERKPPVGIVVMPYIGTPAPWYAIALAMALAQRGQKVELLWDDIPFPLPHEEAYTRMQNETLARVTQALPPYLPVRRVSTTPTVAPDAADEKEINRLVELNLTWAYRGGLAPPAAEPMRRQMRAQLSEALSHISSLARENRYAYWIEPGGLVFSTGLYLHAGYAAELRVATWDAAFGASFISTNGIAARQADIPRAFERLWRANSAIRGRAILAAKQELARRRATSEPTERNAETLSPTLVLATNIEWDQSALGSHYLFENTIEWLIQSAEFGLKHTGGTVIIREHPGERDLPFSSQLGTRRALETHFEGEPRVRFVGATEPVSTYRLVDQADVVIPHVSTVGVEAAALGKTVIPAGETYYSDLGIVHHPRNRAEYFELIQRGLSGSLPPHAEQTERAWLCYYLTQYCNRVPTDFTPQPPDYWKWVERDPMELFRDGTVNTLLDAIETDTPIAWLRARTLLDASEL